MYFYELHEGDDEFGTAVLVAHDTEFDETEFLELVLEARQAVVDRFEEDSLIEAIARELQRAQGFLYLDDSRLTVAIKVSAHDGETAVVPLDERAAARDQDSDEDDEFRSLLVDIDPEDQRWRN